jgi:hypothetical protein
MSDFRLKPYTINFYSIFPFNFDNQNIALSVRKVAYNIYCMQLFVAESNLGEYRNIV